MQPKKSYEERQKEIEKQIELRKRKLMKLKRQEKEEALKRLENFKFKRGGLVNIAGLLWMNPNVLLGALLEEILPVIAGNDEDKIRIWEAAGRRYHDDTVYKSKEREDIQLNNEKQVEVAISKNSMLKDIEVR
jgi:hypothetical protein